MITVPNVFLRDVPNEGVELLKKIIVSHGGVLSNSIDSATHVVDWYEDVDSLPAQITEEFVRPLELQKDGRVRVHWLYHPDSYDEVIPREEVDVDDSVGQLCGSITVPKKSKWHVACRFITDCEIFNEWGNELDYEVEEKQEAAAEADAGASGKGRGGKRKSRKRNSVTPSGTQLPEEKAFFTDTLMADAKLATMRGTATVTDLSGEETKTARVNGSSAISSDTAVTKRRKVADRVVDASTSGTSNWFTEGKVSDHERQHLQFLSSGDNAADTSYLNIRRQLIELSSQTAPTYLSATDARRKISGDVNTIFEIHAFLDGNGLINKDISPYLRPTKFVTGLGPVHQTAATNAMKTTDAKKELETKLDEYVAARLDCLNKKVSTISIHQSIRSFSLKYHHHHFHQIIGAGVD